MLQHKSGTSSQHGIIVNCAIERIRFILDGQSALQDLTMRVTCENQFHGLRSLLFVEETSINACFFCFD